MAGIKHDLQTKLAKAGDECTSCRPFWAKHGKAPRRLVALDKSTTLKKIPIIVCPFCDGSPILRLNGRDE